MAEAVALARRLLASTTDRSEGCGSDDSADGLGLSARELDILSLLVNGCSNQEISTRLFVSTKTVERHLGNLYRKLDVTNRTQAAAYAMRRGIGATAS